MNIPLVRNNTKDAINTSIIAIKKNLERINSLLGLADSSEPDLSGLATKQELEDAVTEINNTIDEVETSLQPVNAVTNGDMHSVTSNAVAGALSGVKYLIPIRATFATTNSTDYVSYKQIGNYFNTYFNSLPVISGKTKKVRLLFNVYTQSSNAITIGLKRRDDTDYYVVLGQSVWGGIISEANYSNLYWVEIDPSYLNSYTIIGIKTSDGNYQVGIGFCFAEVYYE